VRGQPSRLLFSFTFTSATVKPCCGDNRSFWRLNGSFRPWRAAALPLSDAVSGLAGVAGGADTTSGSQSNFLNIGNLIEGNLASATNINSPLMYLNSATGNVGIGTTSPAGVLDVAGLLKTQAPAANRAMPLMWAWRDTIQSHIHISTASLTGLNGKEMSNSMPRKLLTNHTHPGHDFANL